MSDRRDFNRWQPWMGYALCGLCLFAAVACFAAGYWPLAVVNGASAVAIGALARR